MEAVTDNSLSEEVKAATSEAETAFTYTPLLPYQTTFCKLRVLLHTMAGNTPFSSFLVQSSIVSSSRSLNTS
jgi:hypothetical protein